MSWTKKEKEEILKQPFKIWPDPGPNKTYGPTPKQRTLFDIPHKHSLDVVLSIGGGRSGKTVSATARGLQYALEHPGCSLIIGADSGTLLDRTAKEEWRKRLSTHEDWDHPVIYRRPTTHTKRMRLINGSTIWFLHFSEFKILRGTEAVFVHIEEAALLKGRRAVDELIRRLSGSQAKVRQLVLTTNPEETGGWLSEAFALRQFKPDYQGPPIPIGKRCECQFCTQCLEQRDQHFIYIDGICPECKYKKETTCPGDQEFWRVIRSSATENQHLPVGYASGIKSSVSAAEYKLFTEGKLLDLRTGYVYKNFDSTNVLPFDQKLDKEKDLYWSFDFNVSYQCSVICQEMETPNGTIVNVIDELVIPEAGPEHVAKEFLKRYKDYDGTIYIYGDPAALNRKVSSNDVSQFQTIYDILTNPKTAGEEFAQIAPKKVVVTVKKVKRMTKVPVMGRVRSVNGMFKNDDGTKKMFINPSCRYLIRSLEDLKWKESMGSAAIDTQVDKNAAKNPDKESVHVLSHPTDALGYYIYKKYPKDEEPVQPAWAQIPGESTVEINPDGTVNEYRPYVGPEDVEQKIEEIDYEDSVMGLLEQMGALGGGGELDFFW